LTNDIIQSIDFVLLFCAMSVEEEPMKKALLALEAILLLGVLAAIWANQPTLVVSLGTGAGLVVVAQKWRQ
jgi:hypothetical protein